MAATGMYRIRWTSFIRIASGTAMGEYVSESCSRIISALEVAEREAKEKQRAAWREPRKPRPELISPAVWRFERVFTGHCFPVGGPKK